jgi:hypothetical protein
MEERDDTNTPEECRNVIGIYGIVAKLTGDYFDVKKAGKLIGDARKAKLHAARYLNDGGDFLGIYLGLPVYSDPPNQNGIPKISQKDLERILESTPFLASKLEEIGVNKELLGEENYPPEFALYFPKE